MTIIPNPGENIAGIDSHTDTIHIAIITTTGGEVTDHEFPTTTTGYRRAISWLATHGPVTTVGVEGTSSYGIGITAALRAAGISVIEVNRTRPAERRKQGKTDRLDAYRAARSVLSGEATTVPKNHTIESLRALSTTRRSANKALQACWRQTRCLLVNAPAALRDRYRETGRDKLVDHLAASRPDQIHDTTQSVTMRALRSLARRHQFLRAELQDLDEQLDQNTTVRNPGLRAIHGIGPVTAAILLTTAGDNPERLTTAAAFAALCGTSPIPVSSGKTQRHRLSRVGDRQANWALHQVIKVRMSHDVPRQAFWQAAALVTAQPLDHISVDVFFPAPPAQTGLTDPQIPGHLDHSPPGPPAQGHDAATPATSQAASQTGDSLISGDGLEGELEAAGLAVP